MSSRARPPYLVLCFARRLLAGHFSEDSLVRPQIVNRLHRFHFHASHWSCPSLREARILSRNLLVMHHSRMVSYVISHVINTQNIPVDDMFQTGVIALMRAIERFDPRKGFRFSSYAFTAIARDIILMMRRPRVRLGKSHWEPLHCMPIKDHILGACDGGILAVEDQQWLDEALKGMASFDRAVLRLRYMQGWSGRDAARLLRVSPSAIASSERRIKRHLSEWLSRDACMQSAIAAMHERCSDPCPSD